MKILETKNIEYSVTEKKDFLSKGSKKSIIRNISFDLDSKKILGIAGESGSGKTTLAKILAGVILPSSGKIIFDGKISRDIQILFQNSGEILNPLRMVKNILVDTIKLKTKNKKEISAELNSLFKSLLLNEELLNRRVYELSGGEQQRIALARLLIINPKILILDEPFSAQDYKSVINITDLLKKIKQQFDLTLIIISHDLKALKEISDELIIIHSGQIVEAGDGKKIWNNPEHPYTKFLIRAENYDLTYEEYLKLKKEIK